MSQTYSKMLFHLVFATKHRVPSIQPEFEDGLFRQIRELVRGQGCELLEIGGMPDHIHLLVEIRPSVEVATMMRRIKGSSSHWLQGCGKAPGRSFWQRGYGVFSVSESNLPHIRSYIRNQPEHHSRYSSREEFLRLLRKHRIPVDPAALDAD
jgi:putative transposase